ncbi:GTP-binding protein REM 2 isoform X2 [Leptonychotes weddellii]|nr:GTP-binding protein REM 2 isoform X2 [Leptonychotes weddellii]
MPVPYKHQLRRAQAIDELDWPPQASSSGSSDSLGSGEAGPTQKDGIFKVMLVGESGVGKSTLAGTFGGLQGDSAHEPENPGIWGSPVRVKGTCGALVRDGRAQGMSSPWRPEPKRNCSSACCGYLPGGGAPGYQVSQVLGSLLTGSIPCPYFPTEDTYERRIMVDKEEVTLVVYDIWEQGDAGGWLRDHCLQTGDAFLIVFSVTDRRSFSKVPETLLRLRAGRPHHDLPVILVGNKSDLARSREVSLEGEYPVPHHTCNLRGPSPFQVASSPQGPFTLPVHKQRPLAFSRLRADSQCPCLGPENPFSLGLTSSPRPLSLLPLAPPPPST